MRISCLSRVVVRLFYAVLILLAAGMIAGGVMIVLLSIADVIMALAAAPMAYRGGWLVGLVAFPFWLVGAFVVGPPLWAALHIARLRSLRTAIVAGALTGSIAVPVVLWMMDGGSSPGLDANSIASFIVLSPLAGISGAVAGAAVHHLAYGSGKAADAR